MEEWSCAHVRCQIQPNTEQCDKLMGRSQPLTAFHLPPLPRGCGLTASVQLPVCWALVFLPRLFPSGLLKPLETTWVRWLTCSPRYLCLLTCLTTVRGRHAEGWRGEHTQSTLTHCVHLQGPTHLECGGLDTGRDPPGKCFHIQRRSSSHVFIGWVNSFCQTVL